jgi:hypothetical protein
MYNALLTSAVLGAVFHVSVIQVIVEFELYIFHFLATYAAAFVA